MQEKVTDLEIALSSVECEASEKYDKLIEQSEATITEYKNEQDKLKAQLLTLKIELDTALKLKIQVAHLIQLESKSMLQINTLKEQINKQNESYTKLSEELTFSRSRECVLEKTLSQTLVQKTELELQVTDLTQTIAINNALSSTTTTATATSTDNSNTTATATATNTATGGVIETKQPLPPVEEEEEEGSEGGEIIEKKPEKPIIINTTKTNDNKNTNNKNTNNNNNNTKDKNQSKQQQPLPPPPFKNYDEFFKIYTSIETRCTELQTDLTDARNNINDLYLEIESVANEESKVRQQVVELIKEMSESQNMQSGLLEENTRLHDREAELHKQHMEALDKLVI